MWPHCLASVSCPQDCLLDFELSSCACKQQRGQWNVPRGRTGKWDRKKSRERKWVKSDICQCLGLKRLWETRRLNSRGQQAAIRQTVRQTDAEEGEGSLYASPRCGREGGRASPPAIPGAPMSAKPRCCKVKATLTPLNLKLSTSLSAQ